ncbi:MAG: hypothetical protein JWP63_4753 [Candidatus Solibacter sp.]|nr:hypothetical protein [Candidatus Solibacter sp.]
MLHLTAMTPDDEGIRTYSTLRSKPKGTGPDAAGQSGDTQGINDPDEEALLEEGQFYEAELEESVEDAPPADEGGIRVREVPEDDVPEEYIDQEKERDID